MYTDYLVEMTTNGRCVWEWRSWEHVEPEEFPIVNLEAARSEWTHGNAVVELADGDRGSAGPRWPMACGGTGDRLPSALATTAAIT